MNLTPEFKVGDTVMLKCTRQRATVFKVWGDRIMVLFEKKLFAQADWHEAYKFKLIARAR